MKNFNIKNINTVTYDEAMNEYTLEFNVGEFNVGGEMAYIRVDADNYPEAATDEWFWDEEENVEKAVKEAEENGQI